MKPSLRFTARQRAVLSLIGEGLTNAGIAERLRISPETAARKVSEVVGLVAQRDRLQSGVEEGLLTRREREVHQLLKDGLSDPEIAVRLGIGIRTAETHVAHILRKLGVRSRNETDAKALTKRQQEVQDLVEQGLTSHEVAQALGISVRTVENLVAQVLARTGLRPRRGLDARGRGKRGRKPQLSDAE